MGGSISIESAKTHREAGVRLQIRETVLTTCIVFHELVAWYLVIQTLVQGNCLPDIPEGEVAVPHAIWTLALLPVGLFGLLATRHEIEPDIKSFSNYIRLFYFVLVICMIANMTAAGLFGWELYRCATDYCIEKKGYLIGGNIVLHGVCVLLEGIMIALSYIYHRDLVYATSREWQPHWKSRRQSHRHPKSHRHRQ